MPAMQLSASEAPFQFNFGAPGDNAAPSLKAFGVEEPKPSVLSSVEVRPPLQVSLWTVPVSLPSKQHASALHLIVVAVGIVLGARPSGPD